MSEAGASNDHGMFYLETFCDGCNARQTFWATEVEQTLINGDLVYIDLYCTTCREYFWIFPETVLCQLKAGGVSAKGLVAGCPELRRGVWLVPTHTMLPGRITDPLVLARYCEPRCLPALT